LELAELLGLPVVWAMEVQVEQGTRLRSELIALQLVVLVPQTEVLLLPLLVA
jgi:hypothetical protein